jgi:predicted alpha/beta superfamily hydrolase
MKQFSLVSILITALLYLVSGPVYGFGPEAQDNRIVIGEKIKVQSKVLNEERTLQVYRPVNYNYSREAYPVLYLLDGNYHFHHVTGIVRYLSRLRLIPPMIVVGLANTDRSRDFLPTNMAHIPTSGGGDKFLAFIETEWIPYMNKHYRTHPYRILVGHSFGGFFAVYTLFSKPRLFSAYIAVSPSLHWDNLLVLKKALDFFQKRLSFKKFLYMTMGSETRDMMLSVKNLCKIFREHAPADFKWHYAFMKKEEHGSTPHRTIYDGLEALYSGWRIPQKTIAGGLKSIAKFYKSLSKKYGYEIPIPEADLNRLGYYYLGKKDIKKALEVFERNVQLFPGSPNVYDSLGEAYEACRQWEEAKMNYEIAYKKGKESDHPLTDSFKQHLLRVMKKYR